MTQKFRSYNSDLLTKYYGVVLQLQETIHSMAEESSIEELPHSLIETPVLFNIAACYIAMYNRLFDYELIKDGHHTTSKELQ